jgi:hypothetical protein
MTQDEFDEMVGRLTMLSPETIKALDRVLKPLALTPEMVEFVQALERDIKLYGRIAAKGEKP